MKFFVNRGKYPGCTTIEKSYQGGVRLFRVDYIDDDARLEIGDKIHRHLVTGDTVCFNRQPSLIYSSIAAHRVVVLHEGSTLRLNSAACNLYNADLSAI